MKSFLKGIFSLLFVLSSILTSCSNSEEEISQLIIEAQLSGLLGEEITITGENFEPNKLQIFFDLEEAHLTYFSPTEIRFKVPRSLKRYDPMLQIINLETNEDILNAKFTLKTPKVTGYDGNEITFDEKLIIHGENFDIDKDYVSVFINDEKAQVLSVNHNTIEIFIPYKILESNLTVKINSQLQGVISPVALKLKKPIIEILNTDEVDSFGTILKVTGMNFNPEQQYGEVYLDGVLSTYGVNNTSLGIEVPIGPFREFKLSNITYKTAGFIVSFDIDIEITRHAIMVDSFPKLNGDIIVYNNKAYGFSAEINSQGYGYKVELYEFSPDTEKWTRVDSFGFDGYLNEVVFDNINSIYLYKGIADNTNELTKLNLDDFIETKIPVPFHESLNGSAFFSFQNNLYVFYGNTYENTQTVYSDKRYAYIGNDNSWEELVSNDFSDDRWKYGRINNRIFNKENLYFSIGSSGGINELNNNLNVTNLYSSSGIMLFAYNEKIICRANTVNNRTYMFDLNNINSGIWSPFGHSNFGSFFVLGENIYYHVYDGGAVNTFKLRNDFLDEIL